MATTKTLIFLFGIIASTIIVVSCAKTCKDYKFSGKKVYNSCIDLPVLEGHLYWNYSNTSNQAEIAYRATLPRGGWIAWAINPTDTGMVGSQALVAFLNSTDGKPTVYSTRIKDYKPSMEPEPLSFDVSSLSAEHVKDEMVIYAVIGPLVNATTVNQVWQTGKSVSNNVPRMHPISGPNVESTGTLDFLAA